ncbi:UDP-N-acetylmuramoyl-tripeptide--D-alanyl-D-alanine ligase [Salipaludibacillus sp. CF4.18]|uniref:UDP-N-acetylmuramoyl-tripeptide--D-alanyl-D- alanine ligase n=1 Tax=Salipaludibacillus sp. CF4.18 TaxID=3373081 RepID=UPI003EE511E6
MDKKVIPIIAITGSSGKTTTKEMIASILSTRLRILKSKANRNTHISTTYHAKLIKPVHQALVLEYGLHYPGNIKTHCSIIQPNISIITNVGSAHVGNFNGSIAELAKGKSEIIEGMAPLGMLYINADDTNSKLLHAHSFKKSITTVGIKEAADYQASHISYSNTGMTFQIKLNERNCRFRIPVYGIHNIYNALFSIAVSHRLGFTPDEMQQGFNNSVKFLKNNRRLSLYRISNNIKIIDDTKSANPQATKAALDVLENLGGQYNIAVLADMLELGDYTADGHKEVGKYLATKKVNLLFTYGDHAKYIANGAIESGFPKESVFQFKDIQDLNSSLQKALIPGSTVLIKGSQDLQMNRTVEFLLAAYSKRPVSPKRKRRRRKR